MRLVAILIGLSMGARVMGAPTTVPATRPVAEAGKISIHLNNVHRKLVMGELANQAGIRFHPSPAGLPIRRRAGCGHMSEAARESQADADPT